MSLQVCRNMPNLWISNFDFSTVQISEEVIGTIHICITYAHYQSFLTPFTPGKLGEKQFTGSDSEFYEGVDYLFQNPGATSLRTKLLRNPEQNLH